MAINVLINTPISSQNVLFLYFQIINKDKDRKIKGIYQYPNKIINKIAETAETNAEILCTFPSNICL